jgi:6-phosphogluconolactonase (cycloisomerase 2 family)
VANSTSGDVSVYSVNAATGALTQLVCGIVAGCNVTIIPAIVVGGVIMTPAITLPGNNFLAGVSPSAITVDPTGQFVYVVNSTAGTGNISAYSINTTTGALTSLGAAVTAAVNPQSISVDASGKYAYVANYDGFGAASTAFVSQYSIGSTGALTPMAPATVLAAGQPLNAAADPSGKYVYVTNANGTMSQYTIGATGGLTPMAASVTVSTAPNMPLTVDPSGKFAYTTSTNVTNPTTAAGNITTYTIDATGALIFGTASTLTGFNPSSITTTGTIQ